MKVQHTIDYNKEGDNPPNECSLRRGWVCMGKKLEHLSRNAVLLLTDKYLSLKYVIPTVVWQMFIENILGPLLKKKINHCFYVISASKVLESSLFS